MKNFVSSISWKDTTWNNLNQLGNSRLKLKQKPKGGFDEYETGLPKKKKSPEIERETWSPFRKRNQSMSRNLFLFHESWMLPPSPLFSTHWQVFLFYERETRICSKNMEKCWSTFLLSNSWWVLVQVVGTKNFSFLTEKSNVPLKCVGHYVYKFTELTI